MSALRLQAIREVVGAMVPDTPWRGYQRVRQAAARLEEVMPLAGPAGGRVAYWLGCAAEELGSGETGEGRTSLVEARLALLEAEAALGETLEVARRAGGAAVALLGWGRSAAVYRVEGDAGAVWALKVARAGEEAAAQVVERARLHRRCSGLSAAFPVFIGEESIDGRRCVWMEEAAGEALRWMPREAAGLELGGLEWVAEELAGLRGQGVLLRHGGVASSRIVVAPGGGRVWLLPPVPAEEEAPGDEEAMAAILARWGRGEARQAEVRWLGEARSWAGSEEELTRGLLGGWLGPWMLQDALQRLHAELWRGGRWDGELLDVLARVEVASLERWAGGRGAVLERVRQGLAEVAAGAVGAAEAPPALIERLGEAEARLASGPPPGLTWWLEGQAGRLGRVVLEEGLLRSGVSVGRAPDATIQLEGVARCQLRLELRGGEVLLHAFHEVEVGGEVFRGDRRLGSGERLRVAGLELVVRYGIAARGQALAPRPVIAGRWVLWGTLHVEPNLRSVWGWDAARGRKVVVVLGTSGEAPKGWAAEVRRRHAAAQGGGVCEVLGWGELAEAARWGGEVWAPAGQPFLVFEVSGGESLAEQAARRPLGWWAVAACGAQVGAALERAHRRGCLHGALRLECVLQEARTGQVEVLGFGQRGALAWHDPELWMRPAELLARHRPEAPEDDLRGLGVLLARLGGVEVAPEAQAGEALEALRRGEAPEAVAEAVAGCFAGGAAGLAQVVQALAQHVGAVGAWAEEVEATTTLWEAALLSWEEGLAVGLQLSEALEALGRAGERLGWIGPHQVALRGRGAGVQASFVSLEESRVGVSPMRAATSWAYAPPEVVRDPLGGWDAERAAVYQVGVLLFFAWTGVAPFEEDTPTALLARVVLGPGEAMEGVAASRLDARARALLGRALAREPARRWAGLRAWQAALREG